MTPKQAKFAAKEAGAEIAYVRAHKEWQVTRADGSLRVLGKAELERLPQADFVTKFLTAPIDPNEVLPIGIDWDKFASCRVPTGQMLDALEAHFGGMEGMKEAIKSFQDANQMLIAGEPLVYRGVTKRTRWVPYTWAVDAMYAIHILKKEVK